MATRKLLLPGLLLLAALVFVLWPRSEGAAAPALTPTADTGAGPPAPAAAAATSEAAAEAAARNQRIAVPAADAAEPTFTVDGRVLQSGGVSVAGVRVLAFAGAATDRDGVLQSSFAAMASRGPGRQRVEPSFVVRGAPIASVEVGADGRFQLATTGQHLRLLLDHDYYALALPVAVHVPTATRRCTVVLEPLLGGLVRGIVLGEGRGPGLQVRMFAEPDPLLAMRDMQAYMASFTQLERDPVVTDAEGRFVFRAVLPGIAMQLQLDDAALAGRVATGPLMPAETREVALPLQRAGSVRVTATDEQGRPLAKVHVGLEPGDVQGQVMRLASVPGKETGDDGVAIFSGLRGGPYDVTSRLSGFVGRRTAVTVEAGAEAAVEIRLGLGDAVAGVVVDAAGAPVADARLAHFPSTEVPLLGDMSTSMGTDFIVQMAERSTCRSDGDGNFVLTGIDDDNAFLVVAFHPDHAGGLARGVHAGDRDVVITLEQPGSIRGRLVADEDEAPLAAFEIEASISVFLGLSRPARQQLFQDASDGAFQLDGLMPGDYQLRARAEDRGEASQKVTLAGGATCDVGTLRLERGATVQGFVRDQDGAPVRGAMVRQKQGGILDNAIVAQMFGSGSSSRTDDHGAFTLRNLSPGRLVLIADARGFASARSERIAVTAGATVSDVEIVLGHGGSIEGKLLVGPGERAEEWQLFAKEQQSGNTSYATAAADGSFRVQDLDPGRYEVQAMHPSAMTAIQQQTQLLEPGKGIDIKQMMSAVTENVVSQRTVVRDGETATVTLDGRDLGTGGRLELRVGLGDGPLPNGLAELTMLADGRVINGFVDAGVAEFGGMQPGPFRVQIRGGISYTPIGQPSQFEYPRGTDRHSVSMRLVGGELRGRVVDAGSGEPLPGVRVRLVHEDAPERDDQIGFALTDDKGGFAFRALEPGSYGLVTGNSLLAPGGGSSASRLTGLRLQAGEVRDGLELRARPAATVSVRVVDQGGRPLGGGLLLCVDGEGRPFGGMSLSFSGPDGRAVLGDLPTGTARIVGRAPGFAPGATALQSIAPEQPTEFLLQLGRGPRVLAQVLDRNGAVLAGADVAARCGDGPWFPAMLLLEGRTPDGSFDLGRLLPGHWQFRVTHPRTGTFTVGRSLGDTGAATLLLTPQ